MKDYVAATLTNLTLLYQDQGRYREADPILQRALAIREQMFDPVQPRITDALYHLAQLYQQQQRYEQAEACYQRVLRIDEQVYGQHHPEVATDLEAYARLLRKMNREQEALPLEARARAIRAGDQEGRALACIRRGAPYHGPCAPCGRRVPVEIVVGFALNEKDEGLSILPCIAQVCVVAAVARIAMLY